MARYAVFGNPIAHSRSPAIHARFAELTGQTLTYERVLAPLDGFAVAIDDFIAAGGRGANVTLPFKIEACVASTRLTARAAAAGAVNTLSFEDGEIIGDNTDGIGLVTDLLANAGVELRGRRILLLGAGGAAQGVILPLLQTAPATLVIANRSASKAVALAHRFAANGPIHACAFDALGTTAFDVVINATAASLAGEVPAVASELYDEETFAYDMMYGATPTAFMRLAAQRGARVRDGLGMLVEQAAEAFQVWRGVRPPTDVVLAELRASL
ncbi:MAG: shikimate dehydrogenase [Herminiimonas sp.]|nr:shikimate dehydrogenase [Herminiimonas sp.]